MKIFLYLLLILAVLFGGAWYYMDSTMRYQPEDLTEMREVRPAAYQQEARRIKKRMSRELKARGETSVSADEIEAITFAAIARKSTIPVEELIKKYKVDIREDGVELSAIIDLRRVRELKLPPRIREALENVTGFIPDDMLEGVYVSVNGLPRKMGTKIIFNDNAEVHIGGWSRKINDLMDDARTVLGRDILQKPKFSGFDIKDGRVIIRR